MYIVRNALRYTGKKGWARVSKQMRCIYTAPTVEAAVVLFDQFADEWEQQYPGMIGSWRNVWSDFVPFLEYTPELRKLIYTTNAIESLNARFSRATRQRGHFPVDQSALKVLYLVATRNRPNRQDLTGKVHGWRSINTLCIHFGDRIDQSHQ